MSRPMTGLVVHEISQTLYGARVVTYEGGTAAEHDAMLAANFADLEWRWENPDAFPLLTEQMHRDMDEDDK